LSRSQYVRANYAVNTSTQFSMLSDDQCAIVLNSAQEVLERVGADVRSAEAREILQKGGCWVDGERVRVPSHLIQSAIASAPSRIVVADRDGRRCMFLEESNVYFGPGPSTSFTLDPLTGERRPPVKSDVVRAAVTVDALPNIAYAMDMGAITDVTGSVADVHAFQAMVENTTKPVIHSTNGVAQTQDVIDIAAAVRGGVEALQQNPYVVLYCESSPPLGHDAEAMDKVLLAARSRIPVIYTPCTFAGSVAPATMAGSLVIAVADFLVGLVTGQLASPGAPFIMGGLITTMQMKTSVVSHGAAELSLLSAGLCSVAHYMGVPVFAAGGCSDSKACDTQMALEAAFSLLVDGLSGANIVHGLGYMESGQTSSLEMLVMDDEIVGMVKTIMAGIPVTDDTAGVEVIDRVGPGGHYLDDDHTMAHFREFWRPTLIDRWRYDNWVEEGSTTMGDRIKTKLEGILADHKAEPLPAAVLEDIQAIVGRAEQRAAG
jgi:trimethylamine---corrinoid protein Co-methyltransferase